MGIRRSRICCGRPKGAVKLRLSEFAAWVDLEMNAYHGNDELPLYRCIRGAMKFFNPVRGWCPIFGMDNMECPVHDSIGELLSLSTQSKGYLAISLPEQMRKMVAKQIGFQCDVQIQFKVFVVAGIIETVRNNVLD
jgi:hypothetical protein